MSSKSYDSVRKLAASDNVEVFDCGQPGLNQFLQRFALSNQNANSAQTYVSCKEGAVAGYYSLAVGSVEPENAAPRVLKGMARHSLGQFWQASRDRLAPGARVRSQYCSVKPPEPKNPFRLSLSKPRVQAPTLRQAQGERA